MAAGAGAPNDESMALVGNISSGWMAALAVARKHPYVIALARDALRGKDFGGGRYAPKPTPRIMHMRIKV